MPACRRPHGRRTAKGLDSDAPVIVKPVWEHGSLGLDEDSVLRGDDAARAIDERNLRWKTEHFAEAFLDGREFNLSLLDGPSGPAVLPIAEIVFEGFVAPHAENRRLRRQMDAGQRGLYRYATPLRCWKPRTRN